MSNSEVGAFRSSVDHSAARGQEDGGFGGAALLAEEQEQEEEEEETMLPLPAI